MTAHSLPAAQVVLADDDFMASVLAGLRQPQRQVPPKFFYDQRGSELFDLICSTPEYYPTRTEMELLERFGRQMAALIGEDCQLIELGSGSAIKTPLLLSHLSDEAVYVPIDICQPHLTESARRLKGRFPAMAIHPICADYHQLPALSLADHANRRRAIFFPGSTIGNSTPEEAVELLSHAAQLAGRQGALLIGVDCKKPPELLNAAYNDASGYTAAFNLNLLTRMERELGAQLAVDGFSHYAYYNAGVGRVEMHLVSERPQTIALDGEVFQFERGETIHTENSYKYTAQGFQKLAALAGWEPLQLWTDPAGLFNVFCFRIASQTPPTPSARGANLRVAAH